MIVQEESAKLDITEGKLTKKLPVFYNPVMKLNRDISVLLLNSVPDKNLQMALPLAGSGIRGIRFLKELKKGKIKNITFNDYKTLENIKKNLKLNDLDRDKKILLEKKDANLLMLESKGYDYIDIDPFGSPNPFLENPIVRLSRGGILGVTATDTSALSGSSETSCRRKYWAKPLRNEFMHETGIRILIRKIQLIGMQNEKALVPIFSFSKDHYYRIFFRCEKGKQVSEKLSKQHKYLLYNWKTMEREVSEYNFKKNYEYAGSLWTGKLWNSKLVDKMYTNCDKTNKKMFDMLTLIKEESKIDTVGFYDLHKMAQKKNIDVPKIKDYLKKGSSRTHFLGWGIRSKKPLL